MKITVAAFTIGKNDPSSRYRIRQYVDALQNYDIYVTEYFAPIALNAKLSEKLYQFRLFRYILLILKLLCRIPQILISYKYSYVWLSRQLLSTLSIEMILKKPIIYDVDDAIWLNKQKRIEKIAKNASIIFAGNKFIHDWFKQYCDNVYIIPTSIDTDLFKLRNDLPEDNSFKIIWVGTKHTIKYLIEIQEQLNEFLENHFEAVLVVVSDKKPDLSINDNKVKYLKWNPKVEIESLYIGNVGIMPLSDSEWEKGKCSFKMLQYMSVGLPVIVSNIGMNKEVLELGNCGYGVESIEEWPIYLEKLYSDRNLQKMLGRNGRKIIEKNFSKDLIISKLVNIFGNEFNKKL